MRQVTKIFVLLTAMMLSVTAQTKKQIDEALSPGELKKFQEERDKLYQWDAFKFLMGAWKTQGVSANAGFEVAPSLDGKVLIITNSDPGVFKISASVKSANYKSITYIYIEGLTLRATVYDNRGGMLTYDVQSAPQRLTLVSTTAPQARINFSETKDGEVSIGAALKGRGAITAIRVSK